MSAYETTFYQGAYPGVPGVNEPYLVPIVGTPLVINSAAVVSLLCDVVRLLSAMCKFSPDGCGDGEGSGDQKKGGAKKRVAVGAGEKPTGWTEATAQQGNGLGSGSSSSTPESEPWTAGQVGHVHYNNVNQSEYEAGTMKTTLPFTDYSGIGAKDANKGELVGVGLGGMMALVSLLWDVECLPLMRGQQRPPRPCPSAVSSAAISARDLAPLSRRSTWL